MLAKVAKVTVCVGSAALLVTPKTLQAKELVACHDCCKRRLPKAKELPIYEKEVDFVCEYDEKSTPPFLSEISSVRTKILEYASYVDVVQKQAFQIYETGVAHSKSTFDYLKNEENKVQRGLIIASGGLVGLLLARRGGITRKTLYTSLGTAASFYAFYPAISKEYTLIGWNFSKDQINNVLTKYGGVDTEKISQEANAKIDYIKSSIKLEGVMNIVNKIFPMKSKTSKEDEKQESNQDMYTTRAA